MAEAGEVDEATAALLVELRAAYATFVHSFELGQVQVVHKCVLALPPRVLDHILELVLRPLRVALQRPKIRENVRLAALQCMQSCFRQSSELGVQALQQHLSFLALGIDGKLVPPPLSEEVRHGLVEGLCALVTCAEDSAFARLVEDETFLPIYGHAVSALLACASPPPGQANLGLPRALRVDALEACTRLFARVPNREWVASFFPGTVSALARVILGDYKQGQAVIAAAIAALAHTICLVMRPDEGHEPTVQAPPASSPRPGGLPVVRDGEWWETTAEHLAGLTRQLGPRLTEHTPVRVRAELVSAARSIVQACASTMPASVAHLVELLVALKSDELPDIASVAGGALEDCAQAMAAATQQGAAGPGSLYHVLQANLSSLLVSLPRRMRSGLDSEKAKLLRLVSGYLQVLGPRLQVTLRTATHLDRLGAALLETLLFEVTEVRLIEERIESTGTFILTGRVPLDEDIRTTALGHASPLRKHFQHFRDDAVLTEARRICQYLGQHGDPQALLDHFLGLYLSLGPPRLPALLVLTEIFRGAYSSPPGGERGATEQAQDARDAADAILTELLTDEFMNLPVQNAVRARGSPGPQQGLLMVQDVVEVAARQQKLAELNTNILLRSLTLECIATIAECLGSGFEGALLDVTYPLLANLGSPNAVISRTGYYALSHACLACGYWDIGALICGNADYLVNAISQNLRFGTEAHATMVMQVMLQYSDHTLLPLVSDTLEEILLALDGYSSRHLMALLSILHSFAGAVHRWARELPDAVPKEEWTGDEPPPLALHHELIVQVLERCVHHLASSDPRARLLVMDVVAQAAGVLVDRTDKLLPLLHKLWKPLLHRLKDGDPFVAARAAALLPELTALSGDFLHNRIAEEATPLLVAALGPLMATPVEDMRDPAVAMSAPFKTAVAVLRTLAELSQSVEWRPETRATVCSQCLPLLADGIPPRLQDLAVGVVRAVGAADPDYVWLRLAQLWRADEGAYSATPGPAFRPLPLPPPEARFRCGVERVMVLLEQQDGNGLPVVH